MTRAAFVLTFALAAHVGADPLPRIVYPPEPEPKLLRVIQALLNASRQYHLDPMLVFSLAWAESRLNPMAKSWRWIKIDGEMVLTNLARGLMQPSVQYQDELVVKYLGWHPSNFDWRDPVHSAKLGCAYLAMLINRFGTWKGVAAYNCGPGRVNEWPMHKSLPTETWSYCHEIFGGAK